tara:strand:- start:724 stop:1134 length:411 start_codon:yes stop_codon:yes gene_type:complete
MKANEKLLWIDRLTDIEKELAKAADSATELLKKRVLKIAGVSIGAVVAVPSQLETPARETTQQPWANNILMATNDKGLKGADRLCLVSRAYVHFEPCHKINKLGVHASIYARLPKKNWDWGTREILMMRFSTQIDL